MHMIPVYHVLQLRVVSAPSVSGQSIFLLRIRCAISIQFGEGRGGLFEWVDITFMVSSTSDQLFLKPSGHFIRRMG